LPKVKEIKRLRGGVAHYAAQASAQIDAEFGQKDHLWMETRQFCRFGFELQNCKLQSIGILMANHACRVTTPGLDIKVFQS
jgi:hypothetical protein